MISTLHLSVFIPGMPESLETQYLYVAAHQILIQHVYIYHYVFKLRLRYKTLLQYNVSMCS